MKRYRCKFCKFVTVVNKNEKGVKSAKYKMGHHYDTTHRNMIPPDMDGYRWFYNLLTKKEKGRCVE